MLVDNGDYSGFLEHDGTQYMLFTSSSTELGQDLTVHATVRPDSAPDSFVIGEDGGQILLWNNDLGTDADDTWTFLVGSTGAAGDRVDAQEGDRKINTWQNISGLRQGANRAVWVDGAERRAGSSGDASTQAISNIRIGSWNQNSLGFDGGIRTVLFYKRRLDPSEVKLLHDRLVAP